MHILALLPSLIVMVLLSAMAEASDAVTEGRIKVSLFAAPAFFSEVSVDAYNNSCLSLDNNLIDGMVKSILIGGHDVPTVLTRDDYWYCTFFDNYDCSGDENSRLAFADGVNNLKSVGWGTRIHSLRCINEAD